MLAVSTTKSFANSLSLVTIDVTKKSIEEIAATVLEYYKIFKRRKNDK